jgi:hypothetical protein
VDDVILQEGYGFSQDTRTYSLKLEDIPRFTGKPPDTPSFKVEISFKQRGIIHKTMDMNLLDLPLSTNLYPSSIRLIFRLPRVSSLLSRLAYCVAVLIKRRRDFYEIEPSFSSVLDLDREKADRRKGEIVFDAAGEIRGPIQFVYRFVGKVDFPSLILGAIFTIVTGVIIKLIVDFIYAHLPK